MDIDYYLISPTGNITILVTSSVEIDNQPEYAMKLLQLEKSAQQVGYIMENDKEVDITLRMAAGEFCGNATMSAAALYCKNHGMRAGESSTVRVDTSGVKNPVEVVIKYDGISYSGSLSMPVPRDISTVSLSYSGVKYELPIVDFDGISHIVVENDIDIDPESAIKQWCTELKRDGLGLLFVTRDKDRISMKPLVYVPELDSCYWESSCGSGTTALGVYLYERDKKSINLDIYEPGGILNIKVDEEGPVLSGNVIFEKEVKYYGWK